MKKEHFEVLLEAIDSKFQLTMEAFSSLDMKIDRVRDELIEKIEVVDCKVMGLSKRVDSIDERLIGVETRLTGVESRLTGVETRLTGVETRLDGVETRLDVLTTEFTTHRENTEFHHAPRKRALKKAA